MDRHEQITRIQRTGVFAVIRAEGPEQLVDVARALHAGGCDLIEVAMTTPDAFSVIDRTVARLGDDVLVGVGSVLDAETARGAILSGAEYVVGPITNYDVIDTAHRYGKVAIPGAYTPTEALDAYTAGADMVKIFPASVGGPSYIKAIRAPMPQLPVVPTGGVNIENVGDFIKAGAIAVGAGSALVKKDALKAGNMEELKNTASAFRTEIEKAREKQD